MILGADEFEQQLRAATRHADRVALVETAILGRPPHAFLHEAALYEELREHLAGTFSVSPNDIRLVGSASLGFSVAPRNFKRPFHEGSDLDLVVVSEELFDRVWHALLEWGHPLRHKVPEESRAWFSERQQEIFWGWMDPEAFRFRGIVRPQVLRSLRALQATWFGVFRSLGTHFPDTEIARRRASARLYRSLDHLVQYQANGLAKVHENLMKESQ